MTNLDTTSPPDPTPTPVKPGYLTTEFYLSLAATLLTYLFASGAITSNTELAIAGMAATVLTALGYKVSRTIVKTAGPMLAVIALAIGAGGTLSCSSAQRTAIGDALWDCTAPQRAEAVEVLTPTLESLIVAAASADGSKIDTSKLQAALSKANLLNEAGALLTCAAASAFAALAISASQATGELSVVARSSVAALPDVPIRPDPTALRQAFDELRASRFPGATFKTANGEI
jgi:hypothetical protein